MEKKIEIGFQGYEFKFDRKRGVIYFTMWNEIQDIRLKTASRLRNLKFSATVKGGQIRLLILARYLRAWGVVFLTKLNPSWDNCCSEFLIF